MRLTAAGERLFGRAKRLLALNDEIWTEMTTPALRGRDPARHSRRHRQHLSADLPEETLPRPTRRCRSVSSARRAPSCSSICKRAGSTSSSTTEDKTRARRRNARHRPARLGRRARRRGGFPAAAAGFHRLQRLRVPEPDPRGASRPASNGARCRRSPTRMRRSRRPPPISPSRPSWPRPCRVRWRSSDRNPACRSCRPSRSISICRRTAARRSRGNWRAISAMRIIAAPPHRGLSGPSVDLHLERRHEVPRPASRARRTPRRRAMSWWRPRRCATATPARRGKSAGASSR